MVVQARPVAEVRGQVVGQGLLGDEKKKKNKDGSLCETKIIRVVTWRVKVALYLLCLRLDVHQLCAVSRAVLTEKELN